MMRKIGISLTMRAGRIIVMLVLMAILFIVFSMMDPMFYGSRNVENVLRSIAPILLIGVGQSVVLITGNIDLSIGSVMGMSCMVSATMMSSGIEPAMAAVVSLLICCAFGVLNGELVSRAKMPSYIATLGTMMICRGIAQIANQNYDTGFIGHGARGFRDLFFYGRFLGMYDIVWIVFAVWGILLFVLVKTRTGRYMYAIGNNLEASRLSGIGVVSTVRKAYVISAVCAGLAGIITTAETGYGSMTVGSLYELYAVAVAVIGGISTLGGRGLLAGTAVGAAIWGILQNGLIRVGAPLSLRNIAIGIIVVVVVAIDVTSRTRRSGAN
ncbi:MAG: ABC transporter permease [Clostridiales Family XIII bacterium]|jgi:ribose transport system permease protein|nr:ABC transporter permease [Clostridiales Family XIII bacterium]